MSESLTLQVSGLPLMITDQDLDETQRNKIVAAQRGERVLGEDASRMLVDALPAVISKRVKALVPADFVITQIELCMTVQGAICGVGLSGDITVTLAPRQ